MNWKLACACAFSEGVPQRSLWVALVVGTILNLINQGENLLAGGAISWPHTLLNYVVPFCVSGFSAARVAAPKGGDRPSGAVSRPR